jgi:hypothetical protein
MLHIFAECLDRKADCAIDRIRAALEYRDTSKHLSPRAQELEEAGGKEGKAAGADDGAEDPLPSPDANWPDEVSSFSRRTALLHFDR